VSAARGGMSALVEAASGYYRGGGMAAWYFVRGKLRGDPLYGALLTKGLLSGRARIVDLGCRQGLLGAWLLAARSLHAGELGERWPEEWPAPPALRSYCGIDLNGRETRRGAHAFASLPPETIRIVHGDIRDVDYPPTDAVVIADVLHYIDYPSQEAILRRVRSVLSPRGLLLLRVGDAAAGVGFTLSKALDQAVELARRGRLERLYCRPLAEWQALLARIGFHTRALPMSQGTPFANHLLVCEGAA